MGFGSLTFRWGVENKDTGVKQAARGHLPRCSFTCMRSRRRPRGHWRLLLRVPGGEAGRAD